MTKRIAAALAALLLGGLAAPAQTCVSATHCPPPWKVQAQGNLSFHFERGKATPLQAGPWYLYWPMEKEFVVPAPACCYPFWPTRQGLPKLALGPPSPPAAPAAPAAPAYPPPPATPTTPAEPTSPVVPPVPSTSAPTGPATPTPSGLRPASYSAAAMPVAYPGIPYSTMPVPDYWFDR